MRERGGETERGRHPKQRERDNERNQERERDATPVTKEE